MTKSKSIDHHKISGFSNIILNIILSFLSLMCVAPLLLIIGISFTDEKTLILHGYNLIPRKFSTYAYQFIFETGKQILRSYGVTIFVTVVGTILSVLTISMFAYVLSRNDFKFRGFFSFLIFFTMLFNGGLVSTYLIVVNVLHLKDTIWVMILPYMVNAWWVLILRTYISSNIPVSLIESAKIDGAGEFPIFFRIVFPLALPGIITIALFCTLQYWNDWWLALLYINNPDLAPLSYLLYKIQTAMQYLLQNSSSMSGGYATDILSRMPTESARMAMVVVGVGPVIVLFPFFQKYLIKGLTVGAIKG